MTVGKKTQKTQTNHIPNETLGVHFHPPHLTPLCFSALPAVKRFAVGFLFLVIYAIFSPYYQDSYFSTDEFEVRIAV